MITRIAPLLALSLAACAPMMVWNKPGASRNDFSRDKYTCEQQAQQRAAYAAVNAQGGASQNTMVTNQNLFHSCMNANGWYLGTQEASQQQHQQINQQQQAQRDSQQQKIQRAKDTLAQLTKEKGEECAADEYKVVYAKSPCRAEDTSLAQLSDTSRIGSIEKPIFLVLHEAGKARSKRAADAFRSAGDARSSAASSLTEKSSGLAEANAVALYEGSITWGQYNAPKGARTDLP